MNPQQELLVLIKEYKEEFRDASGRRFDTSTANKSLHFQMLAALDTENWVGVSSILYNKYYHKPLEGVILVMKADYPIKEKFLNVYYKFDF